MLRLAGYNVAIKVEPNKLTNDAVMEDVAPQNNIETL